MRTYLILATVIVLALVTSIATTMYLSNYAESLKSNVRVVAETFNTSVKGPSEERLSSYCLWSRSSEEKLSPRSVITRLSSVTMRKLSSYLSSKGLRLPSKVEHVITIPYEGINYTLLKVCDSVGSNCELYFISWFIRDSNLIVTKYGRAKLELILTHRYVPKYVIHELFKDVVNDVLKGYTKSCAGVSEGSVPKELVGLKGGFAVLRLSEVPEVLRKIYLVITYDELLIKYGGKVVATELVGEFFIDYGNRVLKIYDVIKGNYSSEDIRLIINKYLSNSSIYSSKLKFRLFLKGVTLLEHRLAEVTVKALVDPLLTVMIEVGPGAYEVLQVVIWE